MHANERRGSTLSALSLFRSRYMELDQEILKFGAWLRDTGQTNATVALNAQTAKSYMSWIRSSCVKMLISEQTPTEAFSNGSGTGTAWRRFLAYLRMGPTTGLGLYLPKTPLPAPAGLDLIPAPVLKHVRRHVQTALGDALEAQGIGWCVRALWPLVRLGRYQWMPLCNILWNGGGNGKWFRLFTKNPAYPLDQWPETSQLEHADPAQLHAAVYMALWSWASASDISTAVPLLRTVPVAVAGPEDIALYHVPGSSNGMWDIAGRDPCDAPPLPPEGKALLAGEAIDMESATLPVSLEAAEGISRLWGLRWSARPPLTSDERGQEAREMAAFFNGEPPPTPTLMPAPTPASAGWALHVDVGGVAADGESPAGDGEPPVLDLQPTQPSRTVRTEQEGAEGLSSVEVPSTEVDGFDTPELPD